MVENPQIAWKVLRIIMPLRGRVLDIDSTTSFEIMLLLLEQLKRNFLNKIQICTMTHIHCVVTSLKTNIQHAVSLQYVGRPCSYSLYTEKN